MEKVVNRVMRAYKTTRELTEKQEAVVRDGIGNIVALLIERQAEKLERSGKLTD